MIEVGQKVKIDPFIHIRTYGMNMTEGMVEGIVNYVHHDHKWFSVDYGTNGVKRLVGYKFFDIGRSVMVIN